MRERFAAPKKETRAASLLIDDEAARASARDERERSAGNVLIDAFTFICALAAFFSLFIAL